MSAMLSTCCLLLTLLAVMSGRTVGEMTCEDFWRDEEYEPADADKCWAPDFSAIFGGKFDGCDGYYIVSILRYIGLWVTAKSEPKRIRSDSIREKKKTLYVAHHLFSYCTPPQLTPSTATASASVAGRLPNSG